VQSTKFASILGFAFFTFLLPRAADAADAWRTIITGTAVEAALLTASLLQEQFNKPIDSKFNIVVSDRSWTMEIKGGLNGNEVRLFFRGFLWGSENEDMLVSYSGAGMSNGPISINGKALWKYDKKQADHIAMEIDNIVKFGEHTVWGWVKGGEIVVGGALGVVGGIIAAGGPTPGAIVTGILGAAAGAESVVFLSNTARELKESFDPAAPAIPAAPTIPEKGQPISPEKGRLIVAVSKEISKGGDLAKD
jgi:hypothetical protein